MGDNSYGIPKALVDHVEPGGAPAPVRSTQGQNDTSELPAFRPTVGIDNADVSLSVIHEGNVDASALDALERSGNGTLAAAGYFVAGRYEEERKHNNAARTYFERALGFSPDNASILTHYAAILIQAGAYYEAASAADRAVRLVPNSPDALAILGYAQFASDHSDQAVQSWQRSLALRPDPMVQRYLDKARRELAAEASFSQRETGHFTLRYEGKQTGDDFRRELLENLEEDYRQLVRDLDVTPHASIPVILYSEQAFFDVTQAPGWTGALNDGKLRIPIRGLSSVTPELSHVLKHELAHSFINRLSRGRCPQWLHEGIAQLLEPRTSANFGRRLGRAFNTQHAIPFNSLEGGFVGFSAMEANLAYSESLAAAEYLNDTYGMSDLRRILERIGEGSSAEAALRSTIHTDYGHLETEVGKFLQNKYGE